jgi:hypothetical protein
MKYLQKTTCALALLSITTLPVLAASSIDIKVVGTITPAACEPELSGSGIIDYGVIKPNTLSPTNYTKLDAKQLDFTITCDALAKIALTTSNGRIGSVAGTTESIHGYARLPPGLFIFNSSAVYVAGLGLAPNGQKIGGYGLRIVPGTVTADSLAVDSLNNPLGNYWQRTPLGDLASPRIRSKCVTAGRQWGLSIPSHSNS